MKQDTVQTIDTSALTLARVHPDIEALLAPVHAMMANVRK